MAPRSSRPSKRLARTTIIKADFDRPDYDYLLLNEIRQRTQGESEPIVIYLSINSELFSRLSRLISEEDKLEIIMHNITPTYANIIASASNINTISGLKTICRNYESVQTRINNFQEPPKITPDTLAPELAYKGKTKIQNTQPNLNYNKTDLVKPNYSKPNSKPNFTNTKHNQNNNYVHAIDREKPRYYPRCRINTQNLRQCTADKNTVFCFKCGYLNVKTPNCPNCTSCPSSSKKLINKNYVDTPKFDLDDWKSWLQTDYIR